MSRTLSSPSAGSTVVDKLKVYEGGTGATNATAAAAALGAIPVSQIGVPGGIAGLTASGKLDPSNIPDDTVGTVNVLGATTAIVSSVQLYEITNYDIFTDYVVEAIRGTVTRAGSIITYTAPSSVGSGTGGFKINGRTIAISLIGVKPNTPTMVANDSGSSNSQIFITAAGSAYSSNVPAYGYTHLNTDWQISTDVGFSNIVAQSMTDATNKLSYSFSAGLQLNTTYYVRCRYRDSNNNVSDWSNIITVQTKAAYSLLSEKAMISPTVKNANAYFGSKVAVSSDGSRVAVAAYYEKNSSNVNTGAAYVFVKNGTSWVQEAKLNPSPELTGSGTEIGCSISMSADGSRVVVGCKDFNANNTYGCMFVFSRNVSTNVWTQEQRINDPVPTSTAGSGSDTKSYFGSSLEMDQSGSRIVVGSYGNDSSGVNNGQAYVFLRTGTTWALERTIATPSALLGDYPTNGVQNFFGIDVSISGDGTRVAISFTGYQSGNNDRRVAIYSRTGTTWSFEQYIVFPATNANLDVELDGTGTRLAISRPDETINFSSDGAVYIWVRSGTTWTQEAKLFIGVNTVSGNGFGGSISFNSDGSSIVILRKKDNTASYGAAMYNYVRNGTTWTLNDKFYGATASSGSSNDVAVSDNGGTAVMGYEYQSVSGVSCGAAVIFTS